MKWVKHMTATWDDERIARLTEGGGIDALASYGLWWRVLEIVASQMDGKSENCSVTYGVTRWSLLLSLRGSHVRHWLEKLAVSGLVTVEWVSTDIKVTIPKLLKYRDEYSTKSRQTPHKEVEGEQIQKKTKETPAQTTVPPPEVRVAEVVEIPIVKAARKAPSTEAVDEWYNAEFYPIYPLHKARGPGLDAARKNLQTADLRSLALKALREQIPEMNSREPSKRPYPAKWIGDKRWEDEPAPLFAAISANGNRQQYQHPERTMREVPRVHRPTKEEMEG